MGLEGVRQFRGRPARHRHLPPGQSRIYRPRRLVLGRSRRGEQVAYPDTLVGTDSHTTMVNGLGVLGWGVGGIEAEAAMLGQPVSMLIPEVVGFHLTGALQEGITATDLVLTVTQMLRARGVVGRFVEFYGEGVSALSVADRATIANMAPEYGATCGFFPVDGKTLDYMRLTGRSEEQIALTEAYAKAQGLWLEPGAYHEPLFTDTLALDMDCVEPSLAGPKRPQDKVPLSPRRRGVRRQFHQGIWPRARRAGAAPPGRRRRRRARHRPWRRRHRRHHLVHQHLQPGGADRRRPRRPQGARRRGSNSKPWVKTSLAPGSQVVTDYLDRAGLSEDLNAIGFDLVGYGCTTCIGNSGPLPEPISAAIAKHDLVAASVLSGNRNFEGRVSPDVRANYLASPPLVVAYALKGTVAGDMIEEPLGTGSDGEPVFLKDVWPTNEEVRRLIDAHVHGDMFRARYADVYKGDAQWRAIPVAGGETYAWSAGSTYIQNPPYFEGMTMTPVPPSDIVDARPLAIFGDSITTDHISPAGAIKLDSPAGTYLSEHQVARADFNSYGARRGNHEVMMRGTFANIRIKNRMVPGTEGGLTRHIPVGRDAAHLRRGDALQGGGHSAASSSPARNMAPARRATGRPRAPTCSACAPSSPRPTSASTAPTWSAWASSRSSSSATCRSSTAPRPSPSPASPTLQPRQEIEVQVTKADGSAFAFTARVRIDTLNELEYFRAGGILHYVLRKLGRLSGEVGAR